jgi:uroporphyrinogen decarboxylase
MQLTCGERVVRCFLGEPVDHVPFGVGIGWAPWGETYARWCAETGKPALNVAAELGFERSFACPPVTLGLLPGFEHTILCEDAETITYRDARGITKRDRRDGHSMPQFLDYPVKNWADWEALKAERLRIDDPARTALDWDAFRAQLAATGEAVQVGWFPYGHFGTPRDLMGDEELLVAFYDEPALVADMMEHLTSLWLAIYTRVAAEVQIDHIHIWEDMSGRQGSLISMDMVERFMMPQYDRIVDFAKTHGVRIVSVDTDGDCAELVPVMHRHGVNMFLPFEVQAGNDILEYRRKYPHLGILGGLDKRALAAGKAEIDIELEKARRMLAFGRFVPGFDHLIPPDVSWDNFRYAAERMRELCYGAVSV